MLTEALIQSAHEPAFGTGSFIIGCIIIGLPLIGGIWHGIERTWARYDAWRRRK